MWGKIIIPMYKLWLNGLYGLYGPRCPLFSKRPINLISLSLSLGAWSAPSLYLNQCWNIVDWTIGSILQWNHNRNLCIYIQENAFENVVWEMAAILSRPQCVKSPVSSEGQLPQKHTSTVYWCIASKLKVPLIFYGMNKTLLGVDLSFFNQSHSGGITMTKKAYRIYDGTTIQEVVGHLH